MGGDRLQSNYVNWVLPVIGPEKGLLWMQAVLERFAKFLLVYMKEV